MTGQDSARGPARDASHDATLDPALGVAAFAAFREAVHGDFHLMRRVRGPAERDAFAAHAVALGAERGFSFAATDVVAAMRVGEQTWLMQGVDIER